MQPLPAPALGYKRVCTRCLTPFGSGIIALQPAFALGVALLVLLGLAQCYPIMSIQSGGFGHTAYIASGVGRLENLTFPSLALLVLGMAIAAPIIRIGGMSWILGNLRLSRTPDYLVHIFRITEYLRPWAMLDVVLLAAIVSFNKLRDLAYVELGIGFWALAFFVLILFCFDAAIDRHAIWDALKPSPLFTATGPDPKLWNHCHVCSYLQKKEATSSHPHCKRCGATISHRKPASLSNCWALVITGLILYIPANVYPVLTTVSLGRETPSTIMGGVRQLLNGNDWPLAIILFIASIIIPLLKLIGMLWLMVSVQYRSRTFPIARTRLYRFISFIGRWSNTDIFVGALLTGLVTLGNIANVVPENGALAFGAVVILTMLAAEHFDPRLIWDVAEKKRA